MSIDECLTVYFGSCITWHDARRRFDTVNNLNCTVFSKFTFKRVQTVRINNISASSTSVSTLAASSDSTASSPAMLSSCIELGLEPDRQTVCRGMKRRWSAAEVDVFNKRFRSNIDGKKKPTATELREAMSELPNRTTAQIRVRINNVRLGKQK